MYTYHLGMFRGFDRGGPAERSLAEAYVARGMCCLTKVEVCAAGVALRIVWRSAAATGDRNDCMLTPDDSVQLQYGQHESSACF